MIAYFSSRSACLPVRQLHTRKSRFVIHFVAIPAHEPNLPTVISTEAQRSGEICHTNKK